MTIEREIKDSFYIRSCGLKLKFFRRAFALKGGPVLSAIGASEEAAKENLKALLKRFINPPKGRAL